MVQDQASESSEEDDRQPFLAVMASIQLDRLPAYASTIRRTHQHGHQSTEVYATEVGPPIFGSYHVLYPIVFQRQDPLVAQSASRWDTRQVWPI